MRAHELLVVTAALGCAGGQAIGRTATPVPRPPSPAIYRYKIYRGMSPGSFDSIWTKTLSDTSLSYQDSEVVNRSTYYYAVTAEDSNYQESDYSAGVSAVPYGITIYVYASALAQA